MVAGCPATRTSPGPRQVSKSRLLETDRTQTNSDPNTLSLPLYTLSQARLGSGHLRVGAGGRGGGGGGCRGARTNLPGSTSTTLLGEGVLDLLK